MTEIPTSSSSVDASGKDTIGVASTEVGNENTYKVRSLHLDATYSRLRKRTQEKTRNGSTSHSHGPARHLHWTLPDLIASMISRQCYRV